MQDAYFGLYEAVKGFDESKGYKFLTYAKYHIQTAIQRGKLKSSDLPRICLQSKDGKYCVSVQSLCNHSEDTRHTQN